MQNKKTIPIFVPHVGCPNDCIFCNQKKITGVDTLVTGETVKNIIDEYIKTIDEKAEIEVAFFGGSFTAIELETQIELLEAAYKYIKEGKISYIRVSTRPDAIDEQRLSILKKYGVKIIELGVQSLDDKVLLNSNRGHNSNCVKTSSKLIKEYGFILGLQMMVGLPGDTKEKSINTAYKFVEYKADLVRIYPVLVIKDTELLNMMDAGLYKPISIEYTSEVVSLLIAIFMTYNIKIIRVGLQATDTINYGKDVVAGPFHPALGEICYSTLLRKWIELYTTEETKNIKVLCKKNLVSKFLGNKKTNKIYFKNKNIEYTVSDSSDNVVIIDDKKIYIPEDYYKEVESRIIKEV